MVLYYVVYCVVVSKDMKCNKSIAAMIYTREKSCSKTTFHSRWVSLKVGLESRVTL